MKTIISKSGKVITFRSPQKNDLKSLFKYAKEIEAEDTFITLNPDEPLTLKEEKDLFKNDLNKQKKKEKEIIYVFHEKKMIGSCSIKKGGRRKKHIGSLGIALLKKYRSEGIGKKLIQHTITQAKKNLQLTQITLECLANNHIALKFYKNFEFKEMGRHPKANMYQGSFIDEILFYKNLA